MRASKPTTSFKVVDFVPEHADDLWERNSTLATADRGFMTKDNVKAMALKGHAFSLLTNGHLVFSAGIFPIWDGMGEAWVVPSDLIRQYKREFVRYVRGYMDQLAKENSYHRIQATARSDFPQGQRFLEFLGFTREGLMHRYGPDGSDHYLYARLV